MSTPTPHDAPAGTPGASQRDLQSVWGGVMLIAIAAFAFYAMRDLDTGTLGNLGPGGVPRASAVLVTLVGLLLSSMALPDAAMCCRLTACAAC